MSDTRRSPWPRASTWACARRWRTTPRSCIMGEDVGKLGGVFRITDGLQKDFGEDRVIDSPLAESGIVGTAVGMALRGYRPVVEIQFDGFVYPAYDQIVCQVAKMHFRSQGQAPRCRWSSGSRSAAASARSSTTASRRRRSSRTRPGLKVVACSNPVDGYWMIQQAIACDDPVIFLEPKRQYHADKAELDETATPDPLFTSRVVRRGTRRHAARLRPDREDRAARPPRPPPARAGRSRSSTCARCRPLDMAPGLRLRTPHRPRRRHPRGPRQPRHGRRARRPDHRGVLLLPGGAGAARRRLRHAVPALADRGGLPPRPRPGARRRRPHRSTSERDHRCPSTSCPTSARASPRPRS